MLLSFLSYSLFLMQQTPRAIVVKCDGSVYDVDVDVDVDVCYFVVRFLGALLTVLRNLL